MFGFGPPDLPDLLALLAGGSVHADSVELKTLLAPPAEAAAEALTGRRAPTWSVRPTHLLDTAALDLVHAGVEIRLRRRTRGRYDLAVAARRSGIAGGGPAAPPGARVELDVVPGALWRDVEVRCEVDPTAADEVIAGTRDAGTLLTGPQRAWACRGGSHAVAEERLSALRAHGPLEVARVKVAAARLGLRRVDLEHVRFPGDRELVELSTHCRPPEIARTITAFERLIAEHGVAVEPAHRTKTSVWCEETGGADGP